MSQQQQLRSRGAKVFHPLRGFVPGQPARVLRSPRCPAQRVGRGQLITLGTGLSLTRRRGWADRPRPLRTQCVRTRRAVAFVNGLVDIPGWGKDLPSTSAAIKSKQGCGWAPPPHTGAGNRREVPLVRWLLL